MFFVKRTCVRVCVCVCVCVCVRGAASLQVPSPTYYFNVRLQIMFLTSKLQL